MLGTFDRIALVTEASLELGMQFLELLFEALHSGFKRLSDRYSVRGEGMACFWVHGTTFVEPTSRLLPGNRDLD